MAAPQTIFVSGAGGHLGKLIVSELLSFNSEGGEGYNVVAGSQNPGELGDLARLGAELRLFDLDSYELTRSALQGVDILVLVSTKEFQKRILQHRTAIHAAEAAGVGHVIYTSFVNPKPGEGLFNDHFYTEADLVTSSMHWTILRNNCYAETLFFSANPNFLKRGLLPTTSPTGGRAYICRLDCASMAAAVAMNASKYDQKIFDVSGDEALSLPDIADILSKVTSHPIEVKPMSTSDYCNELEAAMVPEWWINISPDLEAAAASGALGITNSGTFKAVVGRDPISLRMFVQTNHAHFSRQ